MREELEKRVCSKCNKSVVGIPVRFAPQAWIGWFEIVGIVKDGKLLLDFCSDKCLVKYFTK